MRKGIYFEWFLMKTFLIHHGIFLEICQFFFLFFQTLIRFIKKFLKKVVYAFEFSVDLFEFSLGVSVNVVGGFIGFIFCYTR